MINSPLSYPFVPNISYKEGEETSIEQFLWIRIYLKNISIENQNFNIQNIYLLKENKKIDSIPISKLLTDYPMNINEKPLFWYSIPKEPIIYFKSDSNWLKNFYINSSIKNQSDIKLSYYKNYYKNFNSFTIENEKEILFYLAFPHIKEDSETPHEFVYESSSCNIHFSFFYLLNLEKGPELQDKKYAKKIQDVYNQLEKQNSRWKEQLDTYLEKHNYKELNILKLF